MNILLSHWIRSDAAQGAAYVVLTFACIFGISGFFVCLINGLMEGKTWAKAVGISILSIFGVAILASIFVALVNVLGV